MSVYRAHPGEPLSPSERKVLFLTAQGLRNDGVARQLFLTTNTVKSHLKNAFIKLGANDRAHAVALAFQTRELWLDLTGTMRAGHPELWPGHHDSRLAS